jgi:hypothetical protein
MTLTTINLAALGDTINLSTEVTGTLPTGNGGTGSTATTFVNAASNVTGTLPSANLPTVPVTKGGTGLTSGTTDQFLKFTGTTTVASATAGISEADNWRITADSSNSGAGREILTSNWERNDTNFQQIGTGVSESSGNFSFPSTGKWFIQLSYCWQSIDSGGTNQPHLYVIAEIQATTNNSSYDRIARSPTSNDNTGGTYWKSSYVSVMLDVTDISNQKVNFSAYRANGLKVMGASGHGDTSVTFIKMGDT